MKMNSTLDHIPDDAASNVSDANKVPENMTQLNIVEQEANKSASNPNEIKRRVMSVLQMSEEGERQESGDENILKISRGLEIDMEKLRRQLKAKHLTIMKIADKDIGNLKGQSCMIQYLPSITIAVIGAVTLFVAITLVVIGNSELSKTYEHVNIPSLQGSIRVYSIGGKHLKYANDLKYISNVAARNLRQLLEPKLLEVYRSASLDVQSVLVYSLKYGTIAGTDLLLSGGEAQFKESFENVTVPEKAQRIHKGESLIIRHWVYLNTNTTLKENEIVFKIKNSSAISDGFDADLKSITVVKLHSMTAAETIFVLTQSGFFKQGILNLDEGLLEKIGLVNAPLNIGLQTSSSEGLCPGLKSPDNGNIFPNECQQSEDTFFGMICSVVCDSQYAPSGSIKRVCLYTGQWSGNPASCNPTCPMLETQKMWSVYPKSCSKNKTFVGQLCVLQCPASHQIYIPNIVVLFSELTIHGLEFYGKYPKFLETACIQKVYVNEDTFQRGYETFAAMNIFDEQHASLQYLQRVKSIFLQCKIPGTIRLTGETLTAGVGKLWPLDFNRGEKSSYTRECLSNMKWSGHAGFCKARCSYLPLSDTQQILSSSSARCYSQPLAGDICWIACDTGYVFEDGCTKMPLTCDLSGAWSAILLQCKKTCQPIALTEGMQVQPLLCSHTPHSGMQCSFSCNSGYHLNGIHSSMCLSNGTWSNEQPVCLSHCSSLSEVANGIIVTEKGACSVSKPPSGSVCSLFCGASFAPSISSITCENGSWSGTDWKCTRACSRLGKVLNGNLSPSSCTESGHHMQHPSCKLECNSGYNSTGDVNVTCDFELGYWYNSPGTCEVFCPALSLSQLKGVSLNCSGIQPSGTVCKLTCYQGLQESGSKYITCQKTGKWNDQPECATAEFVIYQTTKLHKLCLSVDHYLNVVKIYDIADACSKSVESNLWRFNASRIVHLRTLLCLSASNQGAVQLTKCTTGIDDQQFFISKFMWQVANQDGLYLMSGPRTSVSPSFLPRAHRTDENSFWRFVDVSNDKEYSLYAFVHGGNCLPIQTAADMTADSGCLSGTQPHGSTCSISCINGDLSDPSHSTVTCSLGVWSHPPDLSCISNTDPKTCPAYGTSLISGVAVSPTDCLVARSPIGTICNFSCLVPTEYVDGTSSVVCNSKGSWTPASTSICKKPCPSLFPATSNLFYGWHSDTCTSRRAFSGDVCQYNCDTGYYLNGDSYLVCLDTGSWRGSLPFCSKWCPAFEVDQGLIVRCSTDPVKTKYLPGTKCSYSCPFNYRVSISKSFTECQESGVWDVKEIPKCVPVCLPIPSTDKIVITPPSCQTEASVIGSKCILSCEKGYLITKNGMVPTSELVCSNDQEWKGPILQCFTVCPPIRSSGAISNGYFIPDQCAFTKQPVNAVCMLQCKSPTNVYLGAGVARCSKNGSWVFENGYSDFGICLFSCKPLTMTKYVAVSPKSCSQEYVAPGGLCFMTCPSNMDLIGPAIHKCVGYDKQPDNMQWSSGGGDITVCVARCPSLASQPLVHISPPDCELRSMAEGKKCVFTCLHGFTLSGHNTLTCTADGTWDHPLPRCQHYCAQAEVPHGKLNCDVNYFQYPSHGYMRSPGTKCSLICKKGFVPVSGYVTICLENGEWSPELKCEAIANLFSIFHQTKNETKCIVVVQDLLGDREWILSFLSTPDACDTAGNDAFWYWNDKHLLRHAGTGLCLSANMNVADSELSLSLCDKYKALQQWDCDTFSPYRIILKGTNLGIDASYPGIGPTLQTWNHSNSYWLTFNDELETIASVCSYRTIGVCPSLTRYGINVSPSVCTSDYVTMWQNCVITCDETTQSENAVNTSVLCRPTGVWKGLENIPCEKHCSKLPGGNGRIYKPSNCSTESAAHGNTCTMSCEPGYDLSNGEPQGVMICNDGKWSRDLSCVSHCKPLSLPAKTFFICNKQSCRFSCVSGYVPNPPDAELVVTCDEIASYDASSFVCEKTETDILTLDSKIYFLIQARSAVVKAGSHVCLSLSSIKVNEEYKTRKVSCDNGDRRQYWRWESSSILHYVTGMCLTAEPSSSEQIVVAAPCIGDETQQWILVNNFYPYHIISAFTQRFLDYGRLDSDAPAITASGNFAITGEWKGLEITGDSSRTLASFKSPGVCPLIFAGPETSFSPITCMKQESTIDTVCTPTCSSGYNTAIELVAITCLKTGLWSSEVLPCIGQAKSVRCDAFPTSPDLIVEPPLCKLFVTVGSSCKFSCERGLSLEGYKVLYCLSSNVWSSEIPVCKATCPGLVSSAILRITPMECSSFVVSSGQQCVLECLEGIHTDGESSKIHTCDEGTWTGEETSCRSACPMLSTSLYMATDNLKLVASGKRSVRTSTECAYSIQTVGSICYFACPSGMVLVDGSPIVTCRNDAEWSPQIPRCIKQFFCPQTVGVGVSSAIYDPLQFSVAVVAGTSLYLTCKPGYFVDGDDQRQCSASGKWDGEGPAVPACVHKCPPIKPVFEGTVSPQACTTQYSNEGQTCILTCKGPKTKISANCASGVWSQTFAPCPATTEAFLIKDLFAMITRSPKSGCLMVNEKNLVKWNELSQCHSQNQSNTWRWNHHLNIVSFATSNCLKPVDSYLNETLLEVGECGQESLTVRCGNLESGTYRHTLFAYNHERWYLGYRYDPETQLPSYIKMTKISQKFSYIPIDYFNALLMTANDNVLQKPDLDRSVCSYLCGRNISYSTVQGYILSPGYIYKLNYPAYSHCTWILHGYNVKITLMLLDLDLEGRSDPLMPCTADCLQIFRGSTRNPFQSELLSTFTGNNISAYQQDGTTFSCVTGNFLVNFQANGRTEKRGFSMQYKYDTVGSRTTCGISNYNVHNENKLPTDLGKETVITKWPWVASLRQSTKESGKASHRCTGVLVNKNMVVTAAHCARYYIDATKRKDLLVFGFGLSSQSEMDQQMQDKNSSAVDRVFVHPRYDSDTRKYDVALWTLKKDVQLSSKIQSICLPVDGYPVHSTYSVCYAVGWTKLENGASSNLLHEYKLNLDSATWCEAEFGLFSEKQFVCAGFTALYSAGNAGTGSSEPLMCLFNGNWYLAGTAAYTHTGARHVRRFYTDIHTNGKWLTKAMSRTAMISYRSRGLERVSSTKSDSAEDQNLDLKQAEAADENLIL